MNNIKDWERRHGRIPEGAVVIMNSGWHKFYHDNKKYLGWEEGYPETDTEHMHYPGFSGDAMQFLVSKRNIVGVAVDTISVDRGLGATKDHPAHVIFTKHNLWGIENIANLDKLPPKGFLLYNMPLKIGGGSGTPSRVVAFMPEDFDGSPLSAVAQLHSPACQTKPTVVWVLLVIVTMLSTNYVA